ncbi:hypothetical protein ACLK1T_22540 [Escherichia coli]
MPGPLWRNCALPLRQTISLLRCIINCAMPRASYWNRHYPPLNTVIFWKSPSAKTKPPVLVAERRMTVSLNGINRHPYCTTSVRAVANPSPGAFSYVGNQKFTVWSSRVHPHASKAQPGA